MNRRLIGKCLNSLTRAKNVANIIFDEQQSANILYNNIWHRLEIIIKA